MLLRCAARMLAITSLRREVHIQLAKRTQNGANFEFDCHVARLQEARGTGAALSHVSRSNSYAVTTNSIFVNIDTEARLVEAVHMAFGCWERLGSDVFGKADMRERQAPGNIGNDGGNMQRGRAGNA